MVTLRTKLGTVSQLRTRYSHIYEGPAKSCYQQNAHKPNLNADGTAMFRRGLARTNSTRSGIPAF